MLDPRVRAETDLSSDLAVIAGAGSGKTTALVNRFVNCASEPGAGPLDVLALTFTEKAAAEMKERIVRRFDDSGDEQRRRQTEAAYISTIHGFASRLLKENPFAAGVDPAFEVLSDFERELLAEEGLHAMYADRALASYAERLGKTFEGGWEIFDLVRRVSQALREGPAAARHEADLLLAGRNDEVVREALERVGRWKAARESAAVAVLRDLEPRLTAATFKRTPKLGQARDEYLAATREAIARGALDPAKPAWLDTGFTGKIPEEERPPIRKLIDEVREIVKSLAAIEIGVEEAREREVLPLKLAIYAAAKTAAERYAEAKRNSGALDYHDLQRLAVELLKGNAAVAERYARHFHHILLDEAQDTDELQHELIGALRTRVNHRFMVGDPKQAIYEFRGANPDVFDEAVRALPESDRLLFDENFRSRPEVLSFVNALGPALLPARFARLQPRADYGAVPFAGPHVEILHTVQSETVPDAPSKAAKPTWEKVDEARKREAAGLADRVVALLREGPLVLDPDRPSERGGVPLRPRHVALLFRTRTTIPFFERAFADRGIPYVSAVGRGFYDRTEVLDCMSVLRALEQPLDDLAFASVLRSPFCGASDADLLRLRALERRDRHGRDPRPLLRFAGEVPALAPWVARFEKVRSRTRGAAAAEALDEALRAFDYEAAVAALPDGRAMLANVAKVRRRAAELGPVSIGEALRVLEQEREIVTDAEQAPLLGPADDVVVFTTIHQAKGLEWPVVCLPNLQGKLPNRSPLFSPRHGLLLLDARDGDKDVELASLRSITEELRGRSEAEERRLLYVAMTRARERLILTSSVKADDLDSLPDAGFKSYFQFLAAMLGPDFQSEGERSVGSAKVSVRRASGMSSSPAVPLERRIGVTVEPASATATRPARPQLAPAPPLSLKVTELLSYARCPLVYRFANALDIPEHPPRRAALRGTPGALTPVERGTIVHGLLERADLAADPGAEVERLVAAVEPGIRADLGRMLAGVLGGEVGELTRASVRVERELPFGMLVAGIEISGVIDLAIQRPDGTWVVIDYKSNDVSRKGRMDDLAVHYRPQLELYALALERAGLGEVAECVLVFLSGPELWRWPFGDAEAAASEALAQRLVRGIAGADYDTEAGPKCAECGYRKRRICDVGRGYRSAR